MTTTNPPTIILNKNISRYLCIEYIKRYQINTTKTIMYIRHAKYKNWGFYAIVTSIDSDGHNRISVFSHDERQPKFIPELNYRHTFPYFIYSDLVDCYYWYDKNIHKVIARCINTLIRRNADCQEQKMLAKATKEGLTSKKQKRTVHA